MQSGSAQQGGVDLSICTPQFRKQGCEQRGETMHACPGSLYIGKTRLLEPVRRLLRRDMRRLGIASRRIEPEARARCSQVIERGLLEHEQIVAQGSSSDFGMELIKCSSALRLRRRGTEGVDQPVHAQATFEQGREPNF